MYRALKIAHLLGLALFLGSVFSHVVAAALGGAPGSPEFLPARAEIAAATRALTLPGLGLAVLSGVGMALVAPGLRRQRWLWLHAALAGLVVASSVALVAPAGRQALAGAEAFAAGGAGGGRTRRRACSRARRGRDQYRVGYRAARGWRNQACPARARGRGEDVNPAWRKPNSIARKASAISSISPAACSGARSTGAFPPMASRSDNSRCFWCCGRRRASPRPKSPAGSTSSSRRSPIR